MTRCIRPSWIEVTTDHRRVATGPRSRNGDLSACLSIRDQGTILDLLDIDCLANGEQVIVRITDKRTGACLFNETFDQ